MGTLVSVPDTPSRPDVNARSQWGRLVSPACGAAAGQTPRRFPGMLSAFPGELWEAPSLCQSSWGRKWTLIQ